MISTQSCHRFCDHASVGVCVGRMKVNNKDHWQTAYLGHPAADLGNVLDHGLDAARGQIAVHKHAGAVLQQRHGHVPPRPVRVALGMRTTAFESTNKQTKKMTGRKPNRAAKPVVGAQPAARELMV
mgnify:CR=1 FL=1